MIVYPAMDLLGGSAVRLRQGDFARKTHYSLRPQDALRAFAEAGARWAHVVDLDGARARTPRQHELIAVLARDAEVELQVGGGFRTRDQIARALERGIARAVIGSIAVSEPDRANRWIEEFGPERICVSLDVRMKAGMPMVATAAWLKNSGASLWEAAARLPAARHVLITDISADGMMSGPNFNLLEEAVKRLPGLSIQASGGVAALEHIERLTTAGVIVGKAIWEGRIALKEALRSACA